jgi:hypothetical protein
MYEGFDVSAACARTSLADSRAADHDLGVGTRRRRRAHATLTGSGGQRRSGRGRRRRGEADIHYPNCHRQSENERCGVCHCDSFGRAAWIADAKATSWPGCYGASPSTASTRSQKPRLATGVCWIRERMPDTSAGASTSASRRSSSARVVGPVRTWRMPGGTNRGRPAAGEIPTIEADSAGWRRFKGIYLNRRTAA